MCGIFAIAQYHRALLVHIYRLEVDEPERPTMTTIEHHGIRGWAKESHSVTPGLRNVTWDGVDVVGHAASMLCWQFAGEQEARGYRGSQGSQADDSFVAWGSHSFEERVGASTQSDSSPLWARSSLWFCAAAIPGQGARTSRASDRAASPIKSKEEWVGLKAKVQRSVGARVQGRGRR